MAGAIRSPSWFSSSRGSRASGSARRLRLVFHVLGADREYAESLGEALVALHDRVKRCEQCGNFGASSLCRVCADPRRDASTLCVVARVPDLVAIEKSGSYRGRYHVLHGLLAPLDGGDPSDLPLEALRERVVRDGVREVIIATPLHVEGEATALYIGEILEGSGAQVTRIASGVPHGGGAEFTDQVTLGRAFDGRRKL